MEKMVALANVVHGDRRRAPAESPQPSTLPSILTQHE